VGSFVAVGNLPRGLLDEHEGARHVVVLVLQQVAVPNVVGAPWDRRGRGAGAEQKRAQHIRTGHRGRIMSLSSALQQVAVPHVVGGSVGSKGNGRRS